MEMIHSISRKHQILLANSLKDIYSSAVLFQSFDDKSDFLTSIIQLVDNNIAYSQSFIKDPSASYRISTVQELATSFIQKYHKAIDKAGKLAYSINEKYGYGIDIASVVAPYILYQCGVTNEHLSFYIALGMTLSNIICDILAKNEEKNITKMNDHEIETAYEAIYHLLEDTSRRNRLRKIRDLEIEKSMKEIEKILNKDSID